MVCCQMDGPWSAVQMDGPWSAVEIDGPWSAVQMDGPWSAVRWMDCGLQSSYRSRDARYFSNLNGACVV